MICAPAHWLVRPFGTEKIFQLEWDAARLRFGKKPLPMLMRNLPARATNLFGLGPAIDARRMNAGRLCHGTLAAEQVNNAIR